MCHPKLQEMGHHLRPATRQARSGGCSECSIHPSQLYAGPYSSLKLHHFPLLSLLGGAALWSLFLEHIKYTYISNYSIIIKEAESLECSRSQWANHNRAEAATQCSMEHARLCGRLRILIIAARDRDGGVVERKAKGMLCRGRRIWMLPELGSRNLIHIQQMSG
jgi:hypothetical protein